VKWVWEESQQQAFNKLKDIFTTKPVLAAPDLDKEFRVEADASNYATKEVIMNIEWDYNYYQPWSDNEWLVDKMLVVMTCHNS